MGTTRVAVVADDLIWSVRLRDRLSALGARPVPARDRGALEALLPGVDAVIVDLTARAYDGIALVALASSAGKRVLAIGQHDDHEGRRRAIEAGAERVLAYRRLADDAAGILGLWLATDPTPRLEHADAAGGGR